MALPLSGAAVAQLLVFAELVAFITLVAFVAAFVAEPLPFVAGALVVPFVVTDDDGDGNDDGDADSSAVSLLMCNLCSPFCSVNAIGTLAAALAHDFEQYGFFLSFPFPSADLPQ